MQKASSILFRLVVVSFIVVSFLGAPVPASSQATPDRILVGTSTDDVTRPIIYAVDAGLFKNAGLDVEIVKLMNGSAVAAAVAGGSVQLGKGSALTPIQAYAKGVPFIVTANLADYSSDSPNVGMLVLSDAPIHAAKDLVGKTIGMVGLNDQNALGIFAWLEAGGVSLDAVKFLELGNSVGAAALEAHRVDAMMFIEPSLTAALATGNFRLLSHPEDALGPRYSVGTMFGLASWVNAHRSEVERFNRALSAAEAYIGTHENETKPLAAQFAGLELSQIADLKPTAVRTPGIKASELQIVIDSAAKYKFIPKDFSADDIICDCAIRQR